ncbi:DUF4097 family beta strand repeat-containing protein [Thermocrispum municipale]|jgi:hypothetical protein|uniref:DUF4097 family beta strand repeat-containing protein n=1 Tax=Thermocrispum municipale TaxID=37926 RepID=UPI00041EA646|nr:DUF4097 family beta strand repeat-containing protein [Thermocrispum municipale]
MSRTVKFAVGIALIAVAVGLATGWFWTSQTEATERVTARIDTVEIDNDSGDVMVRADDVSTVQIKERFRYRFDAPDTQAYSVDGSILKLDGCGWWCEVDYEVIVPRDTKVMGELDSGNLELIGVAGGEVQLNNGDTKLRDIAGPLSVDSNSGDITGAGLGADLTLTANSGDITVVLTAPANVTADVDSGNIDVVVPPGEYQVEADTDSGNRDIRIGNNSGADHRLELTTDSGDVVVRPAS